jgi:meiotically up-regulated gene 157 (Mug157) protein
MDDANIPSLLSLPYLEWVSERDVVYQRTRQYLLSEWNPYYFEGSAAKGIGSPHTGIVHSNISCCLRRFKTMVFK